jgi:hypothetical protein
LTIEELTFISIIPLSIDCIQELVPENLIFKIGINGTPFEIGKFVDENGIIKKNRLFFASLGEEFDFYQYKKFGMTTFLKAGIIINFYIQLNQNGTEVNKVKKLIIAIETGLYFSYDL